MRLISEVVVFPHIPENAEDYQVGAGKCSGKMKCKVGRYEWEFSNIGAYRFRDIKCGPWTAWKCCEGS